MSLDNADAVIDGNSGGKEAAVAILDNRSACIRSWRLPRWLCVLAALSTLAQATPEITLEVHMSKMVACCGYTSDSATGMPPAIDSAGWASARWGMTMEQVSEALALRGILVKRDDVSVANVQRKKLFQSRTSKTKEGSDRNETQPAAGGWNRAGLVKDVGLGDFEDPSGSGSGLSASLMFDGSSPPKLVQVHIAGESLYFYFRTRLIGKYGEPGLVTGVELDFPVQPSRKRDSPPMPIAPSRLLWFLPHTIIDLNPIRGVSFSKSPGPDLANIQTVRVTVSGKGDRGLLWDWKGQLEDALTAERFRVCVALAGSACDALDESKSIDAELDVQVDYQRRVYWNGKTADFLVAVAILKTPRGVELWRWFEMGDPQACARRIASILGGSRTGFGAATAK